MYTGHHGEHSTFPADKMLPKQFAKELKQYKGESRKFYKKFHTRKSRRYRNKFIY